MGPMRQSGPRSTLKSFGGPTRRLLFSLRVCFYMYKTLPPQPSGTYSYRFNVCQEWFILITTFLGRNGCTYQAQDTIWVYLSCQASWIGQENPREEIGQTWDLSTFCGSF